MTELDVRLHAYRPDLAAVSLQGQVAATRYVRPTIMRCVVGRAPVYSNADCAGAMITELRYGELVEVYEIANDIAWVQNQTDHYVGYTFAQAFSEMLVNPTHQVSVLRTFLFSEPSIKSAPLDCLTLGSRLEVVGLPENRLLPVAGGGYVPEQHVSPQQALNEDYVFTAGRLLGAPYLWGGRSPLGCDCSGLVQLALAQAGIEVPRDSDQQQAALGLTAIVDWTALNLARGDLIFLDGHVGLMASSTHLLHANAHHMQVTVEPLPAVMQRYNHFRAYAKAADIAVYQPAL